MLSIIFGETFKIFGYFNQTFGGIMMHRKAFLKNITRFIYELGMLKRHKHDGYALAGVGDLPSIADTH